MLLKKYSLYKKVSTNKEKSNFSSTGLEGCAQYRFFSHDLHLQLHREPVADAVINNTKAVLGRFSAMSWDEEIVHFLPPESLLQQRPKINPAGRRQAREKLERHEQA